MKMNEDKLRCKFLFSYLSACVVFLGKELNPSEPQFPHMNRGIDDIYALGLAGNHLGLTYVNS
jgi:hypothetical protein